MTEKSESVIQREIMLAIRPIVTWAMITTSGKLKSMAGRIITVGFEGLSDIIGQKRCGMFFAIEVKKPGGVISAKQSDFINIVISCGGVAGKAECIDDALRIIGH